MNTPAASCWGLGRLGHHASKTLAGALCALMLATAPCRATAAESAPPTAPSDALLEDAQSLPASGDANPPPSPAGEPAQPEPTASATEPQAVTPKSPISPEEEPKKAIEAPAPASQQRAKAPSAKAEPHQRSYRIPRYQQMPPHWGFQLALSGGSALGHLSSIGSGPASSLKGFQLQFDYHPTFLHPWGSIGLGASIALYNTLPLNEITSSIGGLASLGYQARYEAQYWPNQWIVPMIGYSGEWVRFQLTNENSGVASTQGLFFGGMLLLSAFDEGAASEMYTNYGISRTYLFAELRNRGGSQDGITFDGRSYFFGLRFEF